MNITDVSLGTVVKFVGCNECTGKSACFFCKKGVHKNGEVVAVYKNFDIPTIEVKVKGSDMLLELTQEDIDDPCLVESLST